MKCKECGKKHYAKGYCHACYQRLRRHGTVKKKKQTHCIECGKGKIVAKGMCNACYIKHRRRKNGQVTHKAKGRPKKEWATEDLEYICKFSEINSLEFIALGLGRPANEVLNQLQELKANGLYEEYKKSYERKLSE